MNLHEETEWEVRAKGWRAPGALACAALVGAGSLVTWLSLEGWATDTPLPGVRVPLVVPFLLALVALEAMRCAHYWSVVWTGVGDEVRRTSGILWPRIRARAPRWEAGEDLFAGVEPADQRRLIERCRSAEVSLPAEVRYYSGARRLLVCILVWPLAILGVVCLNDERLAAELERERAVTQALRSAAEATAAELGKPIPAVLRAGAPVQRYAVEWTWSDSLKREGARVWSFAFALAPKNAAAEGDRFELSSRCRQPLPLLRFPGLPLPSLRIAVADAPGAERFRIALSAALDAAGVNHAFEPVEEAPAERALGALRVQQR